MIGAAVRCPGSAVPEAPIASRSGSRGARGPARRLCRASLRVLSLLLAGVAPAAAQVVPDSVAVPVDSLQARADSARMAILQRLERLGRAPGADSLIFVQDSVRIAQAAAGNRLGAGMDSIATLLYTMPGYALTEYEGESADFAAADRVLVLQAPESGRARVVQEGSVIEADSSITFDESAGSIRTRGLATYTPPDGDAVDAANMVYDLSEARGSAREARTSFNQEGANWIVRGDMPYAAPDSTFMAHAQFTSCDIEEAHYHFETDEIKIVAGNVLVARGVKLYFADVPVAWLPFVAQSLSRGRSSGLLTPRFSVNDIVRTSGGYRRRVSNIGFYWAMNDYADMLTSMDWFSETFFSLTGSLRYQINSQFLSGNLSYRKFWRQDGSTEFAVDTRHSWDIDERTQLMVSGRFVSNNDFLRENSFNPQEVTQSIDSDAGLNRRFGWGTLSLSANRKRYLSDDRTDWLLPSANVSLSPITLFKAPSSEAHMFNNMTWSGSGGVRRNTYDRIQPDTFDIALANTVASQGFARSNLSMGNLTFSQSVDLKEEETLGVPEAYLLLGDSVNPAELVGEVAARSIAESTLGWSASVNYQQQLIGSTTITPRLSLAGSMFRSDTDTLAQNFVTAPSRMTFGAQLKTDIYGFYGGFGSFEAVRHKLSPAIVYDWSPATAPNSLQQEIFGSRALQPKNAISLSLTQTFEAKRASDESTDAAADSATLDAPPGGLPPGGPTGPGGDGGPRRLQQTPSVTLLAWRTSVIRYDFVEADSVGLFLSGFESTRLNNQFSSDYLRGMSISMDHELFEDELDETGALVNRRLAPRLTQVNLGFSIGSSSSIFRWLRGGGGDDDDTPGAGEPTGADPLDFQTPTDEATVVPVTGRDVEPQPASSRSSVGGWTANLTYSLQRPRDPTRLASQMVSGSLRLKPTDNWSVSWRTAYDLELGAFNDHSIRLTRDLHRWQANFDFLQTATGNWTFRFEVSLLDNRDLKFDYKQRNLDLGLPASQR